MKLYDNQAGSFVNLSTVYAKGIISQYYFLAIRCCFPLEIINFLLLCRIEQEVVVAPDHPPKMPPYD
jgi:hypothetical protein